VRYGVLSSAVFHMAFSTWSVLMTSSLWQCCTRHAILVSGAPGFGPPANLSLNPDASPAALTRRPLGAG